MLTTSNLLLPFRIIDLGCSAGYLRGISPQRKPLARKILLADDSVTAQNMGRKILADAGYEVVTVNNGSAALKKIAEVKPDLIVLDVYMPGYSGLEVCQRLKEAGDTSRIPVLLTVGKLEPFKPEEARRVRAESFIVKPFEASELLSALAKLEDKMVPRSESSKPGRFARAIAAVEEGRYDKATAGDDESGWKNRIAFPSKKKRKTEEAEDADDPAIYNPVNKDLRTVVDHKPGARTEAVPESRVDLAALAPEGLPKDVTAEEIAALAAAAAQIQGKVADARSPDVEPAPPPPEAATVPSSQAADAVERSAEEKPAKIETPAEIPHETVAPEGPAPPTSADVVAAVGDLEKTPVPISAPTQSGNGLGSHEPANPPEAEPVTMAVVAGAEHAFTTSRWMAAPVALLPEEASVILEEEMRKAQAVITEFQAPAVEPDPEPVAEIYPAPAEPIAAEAPAPVEAVSQISTASTWSEAEQATQASAASVEAAPAAGDDREAVTASTVVETGMARESANTPAARIESAPSSVEPVAHETEPVSEPPAAELAVPEASPADTPAEHEQQNQSHEEDKAEEPLGSHETSAVVAEIATVPSETATDSLAVGESVEVSSSPAPGEVIPTSESAPHSGEAAKPESDISATTAAAWASWRKIRESDSPSPSPPDNNSEDTSVPADRAAMAVAAGAETAPEESPEIESIVDSVLADLRPKIVAEISKKLKKKK